MRWLTLLSHFTEGHQGTEDDGATTKRLQQQDRAPPRDWRHRRHHQETSTGDEFVRFFSSLCRLCCDFPSRMFTCTHNKHFLCPPLKGGGGHLDLPLSVCPYGRLFVRPSVCLSVTKSCVTHISESIWTWVTEFYRNVNQHVKLRNLGFHVWMCPVSAKVWPLT